MLYTTYVKLPQMLSMIQSNQTEKGLTKPLAQHINFKQWQLFFRKSEKTIHEDRFQNQFHHS